MHSYSRSRKCHQKFVPTVKIYSEKNSLLVEALLVIDNAPSHPKESELICGNKRAVFLPPNVTPLLQPVDPGNAPQHEMHVQEKASSVVH